jgi:glucosamine kinase
MQWVNEATNVEGLNGKRIHVNDAEIAHFGAYTGSFGIVSIQGHGSNVFGITEDGTHVLNSNFMQYARGGAVVLAMKLHFALLSGLCQSNEDALIGRLCTHWKVDSMAELIALGRRRWDLKPEDARNHMAAFAWQITSSASNGSDLALSVCRQAAYSVSEGIALVGQCFKSPVVPFVLSGSTVQTDVMTSLVLEFLTSSKTKQYVLKKQANSPLAGAVLMALRHQGIDISCIDCRQLDLESLK